MEKSCTEWKTLVQNRKLMHRMENYCTEWNDVANNIANIGIVLHRME